MGALQDLDNFDQTVVSLLKAVANRFTAHAIPGWVPTGKSVVGASWRFSLLNMSVVNKST
jgi:hypothetical protein